MLVSIELHVFAADENRQLGCGEAIRVGRLRQFSELEPAGTGIEGHVNNHVGVVMTDLVAHLVDGDRHRSPRKALRAEVRFDVDGGRVRVRVRRSQTNAVLTKTVLVVVSLASGGLAHTVAGDSGVVEVLQVVLHARGGVGADGDRLVLCCREVIAVVVDRLVLNEHPHRLLLGQSQVELN